jgi:hypothetical protein
MVCVVGVMAPAWRLLKVPDGASRAFGLIVVAALIATPVSWTHYLILAFIPIALLSPGLSWLWFLPMLAGLAPARMPHPFTVDDAPSADCRVGAARIPLQPAVVFTSCVRARARAETINGRSTFV